MSTTYNHTHLPRHQFTRFSGGEARGECLQITTIEDMRPRFRVGRILDDGEGYIQLTKEEAYSLMKILADFFTGAPVVPEDEGEVE